MFTDPKYGRIFLKTKQVELLERCLPDMTERVDWKGHNIAVKHTIESTKVLRNLGVLAPSPIIYDYDWPGRHTPLKHQITTADFLTLNRRCFVLNQMGTMKTASSLWAADFLMKQGMVNKALIIAPLSTLEIVWADEIFNVIMHRTAVVLKGSAERRRELLAADVDFYIVNYEGLPIIQKDLAKRDDINLAIVDEAAAYRNHATARYEQLVSIIKPKMRLWLMTGTPTPNAPTDAWALARLIDKTKVPMYFSTWRKETMQQVSTHKWVPRVGSHRRVHEVLQPAIRFRKKDCIDLPPVTYLNRDVALSDEQKKAFTRMKNYMVAEAKGEQISAINAADKIGKLRQILCGAVRFPDTGEYLTLDHRARTDELLDCIQQAASKVIVVVPFKGITQSLYEDVSKHHTVEIVNGDVKATDRVKIWQRFKYEKDPRVTLCHPKVMAHGLNLAEADMLIFYAPIYSNEESEQVMERINRPGQKLPMTIIRMGAHPLEWEIYRQVEGRRVTQESALDLYNRYIRS